MGDWFSYSLHDLLIFSQQAYFRLYELSNQALWPLQIPLVISSLLVLLLMRSHRQYSQSIILLWLSLIWLFVALWFFRMFYSQINTLANPLSCLFVIESVLLAVSGFFVHRHTSYAPAAKWKVAGWVLIIYGFFIHPLSAVIWGRNFSGVELVGIAPDPTAVATLGVLIYLRPKAYPFLMLIPVLWIVVSILTYLAF